MKHSSRVVKLAVAVAAAAIALTSLSACTTPAPSPSSERGALLTTQFGGVPISLNPALAGTGGSTIFTYLAYDPLIYTAGNGDLLPDLATDWKFIDDNNTQLELTIRDGVKFQDGTDLDAAAVVGSMKYFLSAGGPSLADAGPIASVEAKDAQTVVVTYSTPFPTGPEKLGQYNMIGLIIAPAGVANPGSLLTKPNGTGQYIYNADETVAESTYVYDRNPDYWNPDAQQYERIDVQVIGDPTAVVSAATTGQVDFASANPDTAKTAADAGLQILQAPFFNWGITILDRDGTLVPALADENVRQAIGYAIDRDAVVNALGADYSHASGQIANTGVPGYIDGYGFDFDLAKAKDLMAKSAFPNGFSMTLLSESILDSQSTIAQTAIAHLSEIGIDVQLQVEAAVPTFIGSAGSKSYAAALWPIVGQRASEPASNITGPGFLNAFQVGDDQLASLIKDSNVGSDQDRLAAQEAITKRSNEIGFFIPIVATDSVYMVSSKVANVTISAINSQPMPIGPDADHAWHPVR
ncbi:MAG: ABC transporter substrate-binding protein [Pseudolysinimonas sp.]|uniref:ABC transporter substrate-binding protein n=1 Tax=Pseudolysinimonas sp. TaxID=2680009 RepID=UPI003266BB5C